MRIIVIVVLCMVNALAQQRETLTIDISITPQARTAMEAQRIRIADTSSPALALNAGIDAAVTSIVVNQTVPGALPTTPFQLGIRSGAVLEVVRVTAVTAVNLSPVPGLPSARWTLTVVRGRFGTVASPAMVGAQLYVLRHESLERMIRTNMAAYVNSLVVQSIKERKDRETIAEVEMEKGSAQ